MRTVVAAICLFFSAAVPAWAASAQPLAITVRGDGANAVRLEHYAPAQPVRVRVQVALEEPLDDITLVATAPDGRALRTPLMRDTDGSYTGDISFEIPGTWNVGLATRAGAIQTETTPFALDVAPPGADDSWVTGLVVGGGLFVIVGGLGFVALRNMAEPGRAGA